MGGLAAFSLLPIVLVASLSDVTSQVQTLGARGDVTTGQVTASTSARPRVLYLIETGRHAGQIAVADVGGKNRDLLTRGPSLKSNPRWSNHGGQILYLDYGDEEKRLFPFLRVMRSDGGAKRTLIGGSRYDIMDMAWGPSSGRVAVTMTVGRGNAAVTDVFMYSMSTKKLTRLHVDIPHRFARGIDWSRDGKLLVLSALEFDDSTPEDGSQLYSLRPDGSGLRRLTRTTDSVFHEQPRWSPDGSQLVYHRVDEGSGRCPDSLRLVTADGSSNHRVPLPCDMLGATWSLNGHRLLVETSDGNHLVAISTLLDGTRRHTVVRDGSFASWQPAR